MPDIKLTNYTQGFVVSNVDTPSYLKEFLNHMLIVEGLASSSVKTQINLFVKAVLRENRIPVSYTHLFTFDIIPVAVINVGYKTEFESAGINQSKYKVYLDVKTETRLLVPFMSEKFEADNTVLIAEAVIVGDVPETYTNIPKEDISELVPG